VVQHLNDVTTNNSWQAPLGICITIILVFCTTEFKEFIGVSADSWVEFFLIIGLINVGWLVNSSHICAKKNCNS